MNNTQNIQANSQVLDLAPADLKIFIMQGLGQKACGIVELEECINETVEAAVKAKADVQDAYNRILTMTALRVFDEDSCDKDAVNACSKFWTNRFSQDLTQAYFVAKGIIKKSA